MKYFIPYVFAYLITKAIYWLFNFHPFQEYSFFVAVVIDLSIWIVLCYIAVFLFNKLFKAKIA
jgi:hypothetical protein